MLDLFFLISNEFNNSILINLILFFKRSFVAPFSTLKSSPSASILSKSIIFFLFLKYVSKDRHSTLYISIFFKLELNLFLLLFRLD